MKKENHCPGHCHEQNNCGFTAVPEWCHTMPAADMDEHKKEVCGGFGSYCFDKLPFDCRRDRCDDFCPGDCRAL